MSLKSYKQMMALGFIWASSSRYNGGPKIKEGMTKEDFDKIQKLRKSNKRKKRGKK